ncbi:MAG: hypothetical protein ACI8S6_001946, partial [Myxococcota bacterium]
CRWLGGDLAPHRPGEAVDDRIEATQDPLVDAWC